MNKNRENDNVTQNQTETMRPFWIAFASGFCLVLSFHPFGLPLVGWLTPVGYLFLIHTTDLSARKPKTQIWFACFLNSMILFQCVRLPHWAGYVGWPLLASYLCCYPFLFVVLTRHAVQRWRSPMLIAAPIIWCGLELLQARLFTGISLGMLSHTQVAFPIVIQVADVAGCYTISFLMVLIATGLFQFGALFFAVPNKRQKPIFGLSVAVGGLICLLLYGQNRLENANQTAEEHQYRIALIQGAIDTQFPADEKSMVEYITRIRDQYVELSVSSRADSEVKLIIWPESMFLALDAFSESETLSNEQDTNLRKYQQTLANAARFACGAVMQAKNGQWVQANEAVPMLLGANSTRIEESGIYNSAIQIDINGKVTSRYSKMNLVLFGEYVPFGDRFPWLYNFFPMGAGLKPGTAPTAMKLDSFIMSPNICFESTYPHLIRQQISELASAGNPPDCLVNLSNDGWFWGSNALDLHLANNILRSVENRIPSLIAANTGFSGQIDSAGRIIKKGPRRAKEVVFVDMITSPNRSTYATVGDLPWILCLILVFVTFCDSIRIQFQSRKLQLQNRRDDVRNSSR